MEKSSRYKYKRLVGLDVARGLAIIGMVFVNFMYVFSNDLVMELEKNEAAIGEHSIFGQLAAWSVLVVLAGRAAAIFLVLFGMGMRLQMERSQSLQRKRVMVTLIKRYSVLIIGGLVFAIIWEADILHYIGLYGLIIVGVALMRRHWLICGTLSILVVAEILRVIFDYSVGWQAGNIGLFYADMWSVPGYFRQMFFNGFHPVFPWLAFVTFGLALGGDVLQQVKMQKRMIYCGLAGTLLCSCFVAMGIPSRFFPPDTLFILLGFSVAVWVIGFSLFITSTGLLSSVIRSIANMGRLALSHYVGHVIVGIVPVMLIKEERMNMSFELSFLIALSYIVLTIGLGTYWLRNHKQGPLEWMLRKITTIS